MAAVTPMEFISHSQHSPVTKTKIDSAIVLMRGMTFSLLFLLPALIRCQLQGQTLVNSSLSPPSIVKRAEELKFRDRLHYRLGAFLLQDRRDPLDL